MIKLKIFNGKKERIILGVKFVDGQAELHDHLYGKAELICKRYSVDMELIVPKVSEEKEVDLQSDDVDLTDETGMNEDLESEDGSSKWL